jgi:hypothetical protein
MAIRGAIREAATVKEPDGYRLRTALSTTSPAAEGVPNLVPGCDGAGVRRSLGSHPTSNGSPACGGRSLEAGDLLVVLAAAEELGWGSGSG